MKNSDLFQRIKNMNLPVGKYALFGSAPLGIRGLKKCKDMDLIVVEEIWQGYKNKTGWQYKITENGVEHIESDDSQVEMWHDWRPWYDKILPFIEDAETIEGLPFVKLEHVLEWKKKFGRDKDLKDAKIIEDFLQKNK